MGGEPMEKLTVFGPEHFPITPDREEIFAWLACPEGLACRPAFESAWDGAARLLEETSRPMAAIVRDGKNRLTVFLTLGPLVEEAAAGLFRQERYVAASLFNTMCDELLFQMDRRSVTLLNELANREKLCISAREEPGTETPGAFPTDRFEPIRAACPWASLSPSGVIDPVKSMLYSVTLSEHACGFTALHDCSRCSQKDCPYRDARSRCQ